MCGSTDHYKKSSGADDNNGCYVGYFFIQWLCGRIGSSYSCVVSVGLVNVCVVLFAVVVLTQAYHVRIKIVNRTR